VAAARTALAPLSTGRPSVVSFAGTSAAAVATALSALSVLMVSALKA
jgi:hypothetical protein